MYDEKTAVEIKKIASNAIDSAQSEIDKLNSLGASHRAKVSDQLIGWQSWLGNIAFALSAIFGAILTSKDSPGIYSLISFLLFLITGFWIALVHKTFFEKSSIVGSSYEDEFRIKYDDEKKAAFDLFGDPRNLSNHLEFLRKKLNVTSLSEKNLNYQIREISKSGVSYLDDIWLAMLVSAIYFMMHSTGSTIYYQIGLRSGYYPCLFWWVWAIFMLFIWREAFSAKGPIAKSKESTLSKTRSHLKHTRAYKKRIRGEMAVIKQKIDELG